MRPTLISMAMLGAYATLPRIPFQRFNALTIFNKMLYKSEVGGVYPMNS